MIFAQTLLFGGVLPSLVQSASADTKVRAGLQLSFKLPKGSVAISVGKDRYHYHKGVYYRKAKKGYVVTKAPRGAIITSLPRGYSRIVVSNTVYFRFGSVYYKKVPQGYMVVDAPKKVRVVDRSPYSDYQSVWVGRVEYLFKDGEFFRKTPDGLSWVEAPLGAIARYLPSDAVSVWYQEIEYFESDEVYFRKTPDGYRVVQAPWDVKGV